PCQRALAASFRQAAQRGLGIGHQHAQHAVHIAVVEGETGALQLIVFSEDLLGPGHIARRPFEFNGIGAQIDGNVQTAFQHVQIFIPGAEQGLYVGTDLNTFLHSVAGACLLPTLMVRHDSWGGMTSPSKPSAARQIPPGARHFHTLHGQTILVSGNGTSRGCSPRGASNCHYVLKVLSLLEGVNAKAREGVPRKPLPSAFFCTLTSLSRRNRLYAACWR